MLQYIGARYVPIFYENSQDPTSTEWESNVTYEPMTWVSLPNGNMYLSKTEVPANTGSPAQHGEYWLEAGQFNAYIASLQNQIDTINNTNIPNLQNQIDTINNTDLPAIANDIVSINNDITALQTDVGILENEKFVFIGDSFGTRPNGWINQLKNVLGLTDNVNVWSSAAGGSGFCNPADFFYLLQQIVAGMTTAQKESVTTLLTVGGVNDTFTNYDETAIKNAVVTYLNYASSVFPNLRHSYVAYNCTFNSPFMADYYRKDYEFATRKAIRSGVLAAGKMHAFIEGLDDLLNFNDYVDMSDGVHLTTAGENEMTYFLLNGLNNGEYHIHNRKTVHDISYQFNDAGVFIQTRNADVWSDSNNPRNISVGYNVLYSGDTTLPYYPRADIFIPMPMVLVDTSNQLTNINAILRL